MNNQQINSSAVPVGSSELNQGSTASAPGRGGVHQMRPTQLSNECKLNIGTYNVRTLSSDVQILNLEKELENIKWDIVGISEARRPGENLLELKSGHLLYSMGGTNKHKGVGFLVNKMLKAQVLEFKGTSERVASVTIGISKRYRLHIAQVYAPTSESTQEDLDKFYDDINTNLQNCKSHFIIIMGDFNAKVGAATGDAVGGYGIGNTNDRGEDLINFATGNGFKIMNTYFKKQPSRRWTWRSPNLNTKNEIDYILTNRSDVIRDVRVTNRVNVGSDHRMVLCKVKFNTKMERRKLFQRRGVSHRVSDVPAFQLQLSNKFQALEVEDINSLNKYITESVLEAAKDHSTIATKKRVFSQSTLQLMDKRRQMLNPITDRQKIELIELNKTVRKKQRGDHRAHNASEINEMVKKGRGFREAKKSLSLGKSQLTGILERDGSVSNSRDRIVGRAFEYYRDLYSSNEVYVPLDLRLDTSVPEVTSNEIEAAIKLCKMGKSCGPDGVTNEMLKLADTTILNALVTLFNECLEQRKIPDEWNDATIILLHKKGDRKDISNYRPISLLSCVYKIFTKVLTQRITNTLDENQPHEQGGFRKGFATSDHLQVVNQVVEKTNEYKIPLAIAFVDYSKAFDSVDTFEVMTALREQNVPETYIEIFQYIYINATSHIRLHENSPSFPLQKGVRQGDTSSPKLFNAVLERAFRKLDWSRNGIKINGEYLSHLRYADDIIVFASNKHELQIMLQQLNIASKAVGLGMNYGKTKTMCNRFVDDPLESIQVGDVELEEVNHYVYLGQRIEMDPSKEKEVKRRIALGWQAFGRASMLFKDRQVPIIHKRKIYNQCILPAVTYGAETWNLTKQLTLKLRTMQRAHERIMLGITWRDRKTAEWIRSKTGLIDVVEKVSQLKWKWAGHLARYQDDRWTYKVTFWTPRNFPRDRGRPKMRWRDDLERFNKRWQQGAQDRRLWKTHEKAYIQQRIDMADK